MTLRSPFRLHGKSLVRRLVAEKNHFSPNSEGAQPPISIKALQKRLRKEKARLEYQKEQLDKQLTLAESQLHIQELREVFKEDFYLFCKEAMGFKDLYEPLHRKMCNFVANESSNKKLLLVPRGHFKTSICSVAYPIWKLIRNPQERIALASVTQSLAESNLKEIVEKIKTDTFQVLFGAIIGHPDSWPYKRMNEFRINRKGAKLGPSLFATSVDSSETGRHFSTIVFDDIVNEWKVASPNAIESVWDWFGRQQSVLDIDGEQLVVGTRWHFDDPYSRIEDLPNWTKLVLKATKDGTFNTSPIFPTLFSIEKLKEIRYLQGEFRYTCFYNNDPVGEGVNPFNIHQFHFVDYTPQRSYHYLLVDPAASTARDSCYTGMIVGHALPNEKFVVVKALLEKMHPDILVQNLLALAVQEDVTAIIIEAEAYQKALSYWLKSEMSRRRQWYRIIEVTNTRNVGKYSRLLSLQPYLHNGNIVFAKDMEGKQDLLEEFARFPKGRHDDLICALSFAIVNVIYPFRWTRDDER